jgi:hypothetical protein
MPTDPWLRSELAPSLRSGQALISPEKDKGQVLETYRQVLVDLYLRLPDTPRRLSRYDLRLVQQLWERKIPLSTVETAFLLASARRASRHPDAIALAPIRSLYYFLPVIEELLHTPLRYDETYLDYLRRQVTLRPADRTASATS